MKGSVVHVSESNFEEEVVKSDVPALIMFKDGNAESTKVGAVSKSQLIEFVDEIIQ